MSRDTVRFVELLDLHMDMEEDRSDWLIFGVKHELDPWKGMKRILRW